MMDEVVDRVILTDRMEDRRRPTDCRKCKNIIDRINELCERLGYGMDPDKICQIKVSSTIFRDNLITYGTALTFTGHRFVFITKPDMNSDIDTIYHFEEGNYAKSIPILRNEGFTNYQIMAFLEVSEEVVVRYKWDE